MSADHSNYHGRREDGPLLRGEGTFIDGLQLPELDGALYAHFVRSIEASAAITSVDISDAQEADGVVAVYLGADVNGWPLPPRLPMMNKDMWRPLLAMDFVRFVGEPVALILAETRAQAVDASELVYIDYELIDPIIDPYESVANERYVHEHAGTNVSWKWAKDPVADSVWADCDHVVEFELKHPRLSPAPIEPLAGAAIWGDDGRCTAYVCSQRPAGAKYTIETLLGLEPGTVRAIAPNVGGGFGAKGGWGCYPEDVVAVWAAREIGRPVRWNQTRSESGVAMGHGRASTHRVRIGGNADGTIKAYEANALQDSGAYPAMGTAITGNLRQSGTGVYDIPHASVSATSVVTNTTPTVAFRGAGRPEAACNIERAVDRFAAVIGMDPVELRYKNVVSPDAYPYTTAIGSIYDSGNYAEAIRRSTEAGNYEAVRAEQAARRASGDTTKVLGVGVSCTVESTGNGTAEEALATLDDDGRFQVTVGTSPHGQGHETTFAAVVAAELGVSADRVDILHSDTDIAPTGGGTIGSRSAMFGGASALGAAQELIEMARNQAAEKLEANPADVVFDRGQGAEASFHVVGTPSVSVGWEDLDGGDVSHTFEPERPMAFAFGSCMAVVEVDTETGHVEIRSITTVDDAGTILQPVLLEGQVHGGMGLAVGAALYEEMVYSDAGVPLTSNFMDYGIPSAAEFTNFGTIEMETPSPLNALGVKGVGESGTVVCTPAIHSAVLDALAPFGVDHIDLPLKAEKIWSAINSSTNHRTA